MWKKMETFNKASTTSRSPKMSSLTLSYQLGILLKEIAV